MAKGTKGKIVQVIGTVVDVEFPPDALPALFNAIEINMGGSRLVLEVQDHLGNNWVRCLALAPTEGLAVVWAAPSLGPSGSDPSLS